MYFFPIIQVYYFLTVLRALWLRDARPEQWAAVNRFPLILFFFCSVFFSVKVFSSKETSFMQRMAGNATNSLWFSWRFFIHFAICFYPFSKFSLGAISSIFPFFYPFSNFSFGSFFSIFQFSFGVFLSNLHTLFIHSSITFLSIKKTVPF